MTHGKFRLPRSIPVRLALLGSVALLAACAEDAVPYVGTWASDPAQCAVPQDLQNAPLVMTAKGYDQHETHCAFTSVAAEGAGWAVKADCQVEGSQEPAEYTLLVADNKLTIRDASGDRVLQRCN